MLNAGDGTHEHPTQALLDLYTMRERLDRLEGLRVAIIGDVLHSRVARSLSFGLVKMGADVTLVGPPTLDPPGRAGVGRAGLVRHRRRAAQARRLLHASSPAGTTAAAVLPERARVLAAVRPHARARRACLPEGTHDHASRPDEPRRGDRLRGRRPSAVGHRGAGHQRDRRAHVAAVPDARRRGRGGATMPERILLAGRPGGRSRRGSRRGARRPRGGRTRRLRRAGGEPRGRRPCSTAAASCWRRDSSTCTRTCASPAARTRRPSRRAPEPPPSAATRP